MMLYFHSVAFVAELVAATPLNPQHANEVKARANAPVTAEQWSYFASLGDSFASGPGAGQAYADICSNSSSKQCYRRTLAYPSWLEHNNFETPHKSNESHFAACAGSSYEDVVEEQLSRIDSKVGAVTLSIGASDSSIFGALAACIFGFDEPSNPCANSHGNQAAYLAKIQSDIGIYSPASHDKYFKMINALYQKLDFTKEKGTTVYQTTYPQLFDDYTDQCNNVSFGYTGTTLKSQTLSKALREQLNFLIQQVNVLQQYWVDQLNYSHNASYPVDFIRTVNQDQAYNGHRFCRANISEPSRDSAYTYFFNLLSQAEGGHFSSNQRSDDPDETTLAINDSNGTASQYHKITADNCTFTDSSDDMTSNLACITAQAIQHGYKGALPDLSSGSDALAKTLHPKRFGHALTGEAITTASRYFNGSTNFGVPLRILPVGDSITAGYKSTTGGGYREFLYNILRINNANVTFIGAQNTAHNSSWGRCDGYYGDTSVQIRGNLSEHGSLKQKPNVVIIMAGTNDIGHSNFTEFSELLPGAAQLEGMINDVFEAVPDAAVLVGHIIARGSSVFESKIDLKEKLSIQWNANINIMVNRMKTQHPERRLRYVHTTPTTADHTNDSLHPNDRGYMKIAADFAEGLTELALDRPFIKPGPL